MLPQAKNNVSGLELMRHLEVSAKTAWSIKHKLMEAMWLRECTRTLEGIRPTVRGRRQHSQWTGA